ncbi:MAG: phospholipase D-like domain-containing protein, partial [bacterium]
DLQQVFAEDWAFATDEILDDVLYFPETPAFGTTRAQIVDSGPDEAVNSARETIFTAIVKAEREIRIISPYLVPDPGLRMAIRNAALRGVDVRILTQGHPAENWMTWFCSRFHWPAWLDHGVRIYEYETGILHAKAVIVDDKWATIGSANLDNRSLQLNFEVQCLLDDSASVAATRAHFDAEFAHGREIVREEFAARSIWSRAAEALAHLWSPLL